MHKLYCFKSHERKKRKVARSVNRKAAWIINKFSCIYSVYDYGLMESTTLIFLVIFVSIPVLFLCQEKIIFSTHNTVEINILYFYCVSKSIIYLCICLELAFHSLSPYPHPNYTVHEGRSCVSLFFILLSPAPSSSLTLLGT